MKRVLYISRKGFNYYTDYTELYLHNALQNYGYNLIRQADKSTFNVTVYISESEKYMTLLSPLFDSIDEADLPSLCENFSKNFKSEVIVSACPDNSIFPGEKEVFMFSDSFSAFDEPIYLTDEPPKLKWKTADCFFRTNEPYLIRLVSIGGKLSDVRIALEFEETSDTLLINEAEITYYKNKKQFTQPLTFINDGTCFFSRADFLSIDKGINPYCALLRAKKLYTEEDKLGFSLKLLSKCTADVILTPTLRIFSGDSEIFSEKLYFPPNSF